MKKHLSLLSLLAVASFLTYAQVNNTLSNLAPTTAINHTLLPIDNNVRNLGSVGKSWRTLYLDSGLYLKDSLFMHTAGLYNTFVGSQAGISVTLGIQNTAFGFTSLTANTIGNANTALGKAALFKNIDGSFNSGSGYQVLYNNTKGSYNTASGAYALFINTIGGGNTAIGYSALRANLSGSGNAAFGNSALYNNITGELNTAIGTSALFNNTQGFDNTAAGYGALNTNISGNQNTADGTLALYENTTGSANTGSGCYALSSNKTGLYNSGFGFSAGVDLSNSSKNTAIGAFAHISGNNSVVVGYNAYTNGSNVALLGSTTTAFCGGYNNWTNYASDRRLKTQVKENVKGLDFINRLRPVTYHLDLMNLYKIQGISPYGNQKDKISAATRADIDKNIRDKEAVITSGFIAQEVEKAAQDAGYDFDGIKKPQHDKDNYGLSYATFVVPLVKAVQELDKKNEQLKKNNELLEVRIAELERLVKSLIQTKSPNRRVSYLSQNIPNPSNDNTIIPFQIANGSHSAMIKIVQSGSGKTLTTIPVDVDATQVYFNTHSFAVGSYMYTLIVDGKQVDNKQMILSR